MAAFRIIPLASDIAADVRRTRLAPAYGHPVHQEVARGTGPCRVCLNPFAVDVDTRLLFTFNPFHGSAHVAQPGPVFIHEEACEPARQDVYPVGLRALPVMVETHRTDGSVSAPIPLAVGTEAQVLDHLLNSPTASFLHLRHAVAGCFVARVERA
jgi:hypothetical protein